MLRSTAKKGFTLIELLIVVVIIGILAAVAIPKFANTKERAARSSAVQDLRNLVTQQEGHFAQFNRYAATANAANPCTPAANQICFAQSPGNTGLTITPTADSTSGFNAVIVFPGTAANRTCGVFVGGGAIPTVPGLGTGGTWQEGVPRCSQ